MANYNSEFTGTQVDEAIQQVLDNHEEWSNKADPESVALVAQAVTALQTAMNGKADLQAIAGAYRLRFSQVPMCFLSSVTATSSYAGNSNNQIWFCTDGKLYYHANDTDYELGSPQYILYYCGNAIYKWGGSGQGFIKIVDLTDYFEDGRLKMDALPENLPTGGLSDDIYTAIKDNVDTLWTKLNELIGDLANLAFDETRTPQLTNNDKTPWPENESSDQTPRLTKPANNGGTILVGTASGGLISTSVEIKGIYLTQPLVISVSGTGFGISSLTPSPISAASANAGTTITVTYNSVSLNSATGSLLISSSEVSRTANLLVLAGGGATQTFVVTQTLTGCTSSYLGGTVTEGTTLTVVLTPDSGWTFTGGTISATMNNVAVAVNNGQNGTKVISFGAVSGDIVITATAVAEQPTGEITFTKPTIKRGMNISKNSSGGSITLESKSNLAATTDWIALSGNWHKIVLYHNVANNVDGYSVMLLCKFKDLGNGTTGVMPGNYGNMGNTNNSGTNGPYVVDMSNRTVSLNRLVDKICTGYSGTGSYEITHIAFSVANNPNAQDGENWGQYPYNNNTFTPGAAYAKIYASEDDANPQAIFSADDPTSYNITNE